MTQPEIDFVQLQKTVQVNRQVINRLKERVTLLESALELICGDERMQWLYQHRSERMDATVPMFPESRAAFHLARYVTQFPADALSCRMRQFCDESVDEGLHSATISRTMNMRLIA